MTIFVSPEGRRSEFRSLPRGSRDIDRALEDRAGRIYHDLAEVVRCLVLPRTELTSTRRGGRPGDRLDRCNAILSMVIGGEYPLAGLRRDRLHKARDELASLLDELQYAARQGSR
jgi:hypothetical protein